MSTHGCRSRVCPFFYVLAILAVSWPVGAQQPSIVASTQIRPFVIGFTPVIGRNGQVGGVVVNAAGAIRRASADDAASLRRLWLRERPEVEPTVARRSELRMVSLSRIAALLERHVASGETLPDELIFLGGLQRVDYVFAYPERQDIVLAGPADAWALGDGAMLGRDTRAPVLRLDDLLVALQAAARASAAPVMGCSIDPTEEGLLRLQQLLQQRGLVLSDQLMHAMEAAVGVQQIRVDGVPPSSHFPRVMVAADFQMKRLAMGLERSGSGLDSYLELLRAQAARFRHVSAPRWWLALDNAPVRCSPDRLAWQLTEQGVRVMTEDGYLTAVGRLENTDAENPNAVHWAESMTAVYPELALEFPAFAELRNCMNLAIVAGLIEQEQLAARTGCDVSLLVDSERIRGPSYNVPRSVDSQASFVRTRRGWVVSISGGVEIDAWRVLRSPRSAPGLRAQRTRAWAARDEASWWWDDERAEGVKRVRKAKG